MPTKCLLYKSAKIILCITIVVVLAEGYESFTSRGVNLDVGLNVKQLIEKYGYPFENHTVQTEDGYLLEVHRIPHGRNDLGYAQRSPVLLMPGLFCSSADWVNMGPENSLGFILADQGYDVWLANYRGTRWSRKHIILNPDKDGKQFWDFSFHKIGYYDVAALIDYILNDTSQEQVYYIGHSQGTSSFFALTSTRPEYNSKIQLSVLLAPLGYIEHTKFPFVPLMVLFYDEIEAIVNKHQYYEVMSYSPRLSLLGRIVCSDVSPLQNLCASVFFAMAGYTPDQLNKTVIPVILANAPAGASIRQMQHVAQLFQYKGFRQYDYGEKKNLERYGQPMPPDYNLSKITVPIALYYGNTDTACSPQDVNRTASELSYVVINRSIEGFSHIDVIWGIDVVKVLFNDVLALMKKY